MKIPRCFILCFAFISILILSRSASAYPDAELFGPNDENPPFDFGVRSAFDGFKLINDTTLLVAYAESLKIVDMGSYSLARLQPFQPSDDEDTKGIAGGLAYSSGRNEMYLSQQDGDLLIYDMNDLEKKPVIVTVAEQSVLGVIVIDGSEESLYIADNTKGAVQVVNLNDRSVARTINLTVPGSTDFNLTDGVLAEDDGEIYFTTDVGYIVGLPEGGSSASYVKIGTSYKLTAIDIFPNQNYIYVVDSTTPQLVKINPASGEIVKSGIDISENLNPTDIVITNVKKPNGAYAYVAGTDGVSVVNTFNDEVFNMSDDPDTEREPLPTSAVPSVLAASSSTDGYVYMGFATGAVGVISANPWVTIDSVVFNDELSKLTIEGYFVITFQSDLGGTYQIVSGGGSDASGDVLVDSEGDSSGTVAADEEKSVQINYDDNSRKFDEGYVDIWVFVTSDDDRGRLSTEILVDTPPPVVTIRSAGFGDEMIYVTFNRLTQSDISKYRFYASQDYDEVITMTTPTAQVAQASSGTTQTASVGGLENDKLYYIAVEAIDEAGNVSPSRSVTSETPSPTYGPAELSGEKGCSMLPSAEGRVADIIPLLFAVFLIFFRRRSPCRKILPIILFAALFLVPPSVLAQQEGADISERSVSAMFTPNVASKQLWEFEIKTGFWMPKNEILNEAFGKCCNMITRLEGGLLLQKRYGIGAGVGFFYKSAQAFAGGVHTGERAQERFNMILVPMQLNFTWRADYFSWRYLVPYIRVGPDMIYFRQSLSGNVIKGLKYGIHGTGGIQINIGEMADSSSSLDSDIGINDFFLTLEAQYQWVDNFGKRGLNLSGFVYSAGLLMEF
ncbi:MAG: hypothetical protein GX659_05440 [Myxococcales bacterium]|nr:hypothetical protein [Myxococcales bacterium]